MKIEITGLYKSFNDTIVLDNFNATFTDDKVNFIMGKSGCGKTTLLNILMGFIKADKGSFTGIEGKRISTVFQEDRLCSQISTYKNVRICAGEGTNSDMIYEHLDDVGLSQESWYKPVSELSGGMSRRVAIVRAIMAKSDIVIMDEPFKGLDETTKQLVASYIKKNINGRLFIIVTHSIEEMSLFNSDVSNM